MKPYHMSTKLTSKSVWILIATIIGIFFASFTLAHAVSVFITQQGGTGTTSPSGILYGDNGFTNHLNTVAIGTGLTFSGGTLSSTGGASGTTGQNAYFSGTNTITGTSTIFTTTAGKVGIGTTTPNAQLTVNANTPGFEDVLRLYNQQSTSGGLWDFWVGAGTAFANGYFNICQGPCTASNYELQFQGFGVAQARGAFSAPAFDSSITGRGSSPILAWTNTGGSFNGTLDVGENYVSGNINLNNWIGGTGSWNIKRSDGSSLALATLLNSNNNLGIGTSTPGTFLSAGSSTNSFNLNVYSTSTLSYGLRLNTGTLTIASLATAAGSFIAVDGSGNIIATSTPAGGGSVTSVTGTYPVISSGGATPVISLAFGTTTSNTWANTQTFTNPIVDGTLSGIIGASSGLTYAVATSTLTASSPLTGSFTQIGSGGSLGCQTASGSQAGCLSSADWTTFNGKQSSLTFSYPLINTAGTVSLDFGTTTANTWSGLQTFTNVGTTTFSGGIQSVTAKFTGLVEFTGSVIHQTQDLFNAGIQLAASTYLNFGATTGSSGYGIRDNAGNIEAKNNGGSWTRLVSSIGARAYNSTGESITGTFATSTFDTESYDTDSMHSTVTNTGRMTFNTAGYYQVIGNCGSLTNAVMSTRIVLNGGTIIVSTGAGNAGAGFTNGIQASTIYFFNAADYIEQMCAGSVVTSTSGIGGIQLQAFKIGS